MEYVQDRITTLHDFTGHVPDVPIDRTAVVIPMTERDHAVLATERLLAALEQIDPARVVIPLRAEQHHLPAFHQWLSRFDLPLTILWCGGASLLDLLETHGLDGTPGKGRDVWLAIGVATDQAPFVVCHDADTKTFDPSDIARLVFPLHNGYSFSKGYYARIEHSRLYGRLFRLFFTPLVRSLQHHHPDAILEYLTSFRYALAGEFGVTADQGRQLRFERRFGLEVGILGDAFRNAGFAGTAQVDLGQYEHDHRAVGGPTGLIDMCADVGAALFRVLEDHGISPDYHALPDSYRETAQLLLDQYAADAAFNDLSYDRTEEAAQIDEYARVIRPPPAGDLLPAWSTVDIDPGTVAERAQRDLQNVV